MNYYYILQNRSNSFTAFDIVGRRDHVFASLTARRSTRAVPPERLDKRTPRRFPSDETEFRGHQTNPTPPFTPVPNPRPFPPPLIFPCRLNKKKKKRVTRAGRKILY